MARWRCNVETVWLLYTLFQCLRKKSLRDYSIFRSIIMRLLTNTPIHSLTSKNYEIHHVHPISKELFDNNLFHRKFLTSSLNLTSVQILRMFKGNEFHMCNVL